MKTRLLILTLLVLVVLAIVFARYAGVTHERIYDTVVDRSDEILERIDRRSSELDGKLNRIEGKLDRLLEIAERPLPDGMRKE